MIEGKHNTAHRGMNLEEDINLTNEYYLSHDIAVIHKKPTPIQIVKVSYPERSSAKIVEAYFRTPSTTDYNGIYKGKYIDFEAKETKTLSFPFTNISLHQINHLDKVIHHGHGSHTILCTGGAPVDDETLAEAAKIAACIHRPAAAGTSRWITRRSKM